MKYKFTFETENEKQSIIKDNEHLFLILIAYHYDENYLLFSDEETSTDETWGNFVNNRISLLKDKNEQQDGIINIQLMATDELYSMLEPLLASQIETYQGGSKMTDLYVVMIQRGLKTIEEVPLRYREQVKEILEELEK